MNTIPTPDELHRQFRIPREYVRGMAAWMNISESMAYQLYRDGRVPSIKLQNQLFNRCGIPNELWQEEDIDTRAKMLYSMWYNYMNIKNLL